MCDIAEVKGWIHFNSYIRVTFADTTLLDTSAGQ